MTRSPETEPARKPLVKTMAGLRAGMGVEDIAVNYGMPLSEVRAHVAWLRQNGLIAQLVKRRCAA